MTEPTPSTHPPATAAEGAAWGLAQAKHPPAPVGTDGTGAIWYSAAAQWELGLLDRLVREGFAACRDVGYPSNYGRTTAQVRFRIAHTERPLDVRATGAVTVESEDKNATTLRVDASDGGPAGITILSAHAGVDVFDDQGVLSPAAVSHGTVEIPPHLTRNPVRTIPLSYDGAIWSAPAEVLGRVVLQTKNTAATPIIWAGESVREALARRDLEQVLDVQRRPDGAWESVHELGLRYLVVDAAEPVSVHVDASMPAAVEKGSFACSDARLTGIWNTAAHTLRVCSQGLILDGVKRDRMPWMGDLSVGAIANAYVTGDAEIVRRGLIALSRHTHGYINGIVDYTLWWLICLSESDTVLAMNGFAVSEANHIDDVLRRLSDEIGSDGVLRPHPEADAFDKPVFIDWGVKVNPDRDHTALQLLWWWALGSAVRILREAAHPGAEHWEGIRLVLRKTLEQKGWIAESQKWREYLGGDIDESAYPDIFAVLSGYFSETVPAPCTRRLLDEPATRTPFLTAYAVQALVVAGHAEEATERIRRLWGDMLDHDATSFWEEFQVEGADSLEMYGRPYGKSLCHAWSAGPAYLLPQTVTGVRSTGAGWATFEVNPHLGHLDWASTIVPTRAGQIAVLATSERVVVDIPPESTLIHDGTFYVGPRRVILVSGRK